MAFHVERVKKVQCDACKTSIDVSTAKPLSAVACPKCSAPVIVPAKVGSMMITKLYGEGTGSIVYKAHDRVLGREVALKVMKILPTDQPGRQSGMDEARALLLVNHPNIVAVYAIDTRRGQPCIIMEPLDGGSMKERLKPEVGMDEAEVLSIGIQVCKALHETSRRGLLHLDVKPGNIMFDAAGVPKLMDFGFAAIDPDDQLNEILGTPYYVSPELVRQLPPDLRADIYSLGATLFHAVTGHAPFEAATIKALILARLNSDPPDPREYRQDLHPLTAETLMRMMQEDPDDRHMDYTEVMEDLEDALDAVKERDAAKS
ncbi:serine/threonine protein kinase [Planctomycetales bacterium ZRK34]|nr:serine/threonine protein kinase [Planctomycetales bacterium ZRK34]